MHDAYTHHYIDTHGARCATARAADNVEHRLLGGEDAILSPSFFASGVKR